MGRTGEKRSQAIQLLSSYSSLDRMIMAMKVDASEGIAAVRLKEKEVIKAKLDILYRSIPRNKRLIWDKNVIECIPGDEVAEMLGVSRRSYYRLKGELIAEVVDVFNLFC